MGYTHYWRRSPELNRERFIKALEDVKGIMATLETRGLKFGGALGTQKPELTDFGIVFNGKKECGHRYRDLGDPWPSATAQGVESTIDPISGPWFSGALLETRICGGSCAGAPFVVDRLFLVRPWDQLEQGRYFSHCETGFKPYDLAVTACLIRLKEHLREEFVVTSDGLERGFEDAKRLCRELFGISPNFELEPMESGII